MNNQFVSSSGSLTNRDFTEAIVRRHCQNYGMLSDCVICFLDAELVVKFTCRFAKAYRSTDVILKEVRDYFSL